MERFTTDTTGLESSKLSAPAKPPRSTPAGSDLSRASSVRAFSQIVLQWGLPWPALILSAAFAPVAIIVGTTHPNSLAAFILNAAALAPTAALLRRSVHDFVWWLQALPPHIECGHTLGGIIDCLLGYAQNILCLLRWTNVAKQKLPRTHLHCRRPSQTRGLDRTDVYHRKSAFQHSPRTW